MHATQTGVRSIMLYISGRSCACLCLICRVQEALLLLLASCIGSLGQDILMLMAATRTAAEARGQLQQEPWLACPDTEQLATPGQRRNVHRLTRCDHCPAWIMHAMQLALPLAKDNTGEQPYCQACLYPLLHCCLPEATDP